MTHQTNWSEPGGFPPCWNILLQGEKILEPRTWQWHQQPLFGENEGWWIRRWEQKRRAEKRIEWKRAKFWGSERVWEFSTLWGKSYVDSWSLLRWCDKPSIVADFSIKTCVFCALVFLFFMWFLYLFVFWFCVSHKLQSHGLLGPLEIPDVSTH